MADSIKTHLAMFDDHGWAGGVLHEDPVMGTVHLRIGRNLPEHVEMVTSFGSPEGTTVISVPIGQYSEQGTIQIPTALARTLCDALVRHFGGASDSRTLRRDYDAERARVDRLVGLLASATGTAA